MRKVLFVAVTTMEAVVIKAGARLIGVANPPVG